MDIVEAIRFLRAEKARVDQENLAQAPDEVRFPKRRRGRKSMGPKERQQVSERMKRLAARGATRT